jgi:uncharacterized membrane protein HdeD (DUF308 family)
MKLSCLIKGSIAIIFGLLALLLPDPTRATFIGLFWVFIVVGIIIFLFLATTSRAEESMFWFGLSAAFVLFGVISILIQGIVALIFLVILAGIAFYSGFSDIIFALEHPKTKYVLISGMFLVGALFLAVLFRFYPGMFAADRIILTFIGALALVFGAFSLLIGIFPGSTTLPEVRRVPPHRAPLSRHQPDQVPITESAAESTSASCECSAAEPDEKP